MLILQALEEQKDAFQKVLDSKNALISLFQNDLRKKDDDYRKQLKEEDEDITEIIALMRRQFYELRETSLRELSEIEQKFDQDVKYYFCGTLLTKEIRGQIFSEEIRVKSTRSQTDMLNLKRRLLKTEKQLKREIWKKLRN